MNDIKKIMSNIDNVVYLERLLIGDNIRSSKIMKAKYTVNIIDSDRSGSNNYKKGSNHGSFSGNNIYGVNNSSLNNSGSGSSGGIIGSGSGSGNSSSYDKKQLNKKTLGHSLVELVEKNNALYELDLSNNDLSSSNISCNIDYFLTHIPYLSNIDIIDFTNTKLSEKHFELLISSLKHTNKRSAINYKNPRSCDHRNYSHSNSGSSAHNNSNNSNNNNNNSKRIALKIYYWVLCCAMQTNNDLLI